MRIWLLNASEQLAYAGNNRRRMRTGLLADALLQKGHEVTWWKSTFEHASKSHYRSSGGFEEIVPGLTIGWIHSRGYRKHVSLSRFLDHREIGRRFPSLAAQRAAPDVIVCSMPIPELASAGVEFASKRRIPVIVDVRDWWPDAFVYTLPGPLRSIAWFLSRPYQRIVRRACAGATGITGITPSFVDWGLDRAGRARTANDNDFAHGYETRNQGKDESESAKRFWDQLKVYSNESTINIVFIGSISRSFCFRPVLEAARVLEGANCSVKFVFCGDGDRLRQVQRDAAGLTNVVFSEAWVGPQEINELLRRASAGLVPLPDRPDFLATVNNKTVEYLSAGVPLVVSPESSWVGTLANRHRFGACWDGVHHEQLVGIVGELTENPSLKSEMSKCAELHFREHFDANVVYGRFVEHVERVANAFPRRE